MPAWALLAVAIVLEVVGTTALRETDGFSRLLPSIVVVVTYAVWAGAGTALIVIVGALASGEALGALKLAGVALVIAGIVLLTSPARTRVGAHPRRRAAARRHLPGRSLSDWEIEHPLGCQTSQSSQRPVP